jgi:predicted transcriptional regulator
MTLESAMVADMEKVRAVLSETPQTIGNIAGKLNLPTERVDLALLSMNSMGLADYQNYMGLPHWTLARRPK